jgi:C4-dicarboxylate-specific signal transduction histidine kinase
VHLDQLKKEPPRNAQQLKAILALTQKVTGAAVAEFGAGPPPWCWWSPEFYSTLGVDPAEPALAFGELVSRFVVIEDRPNALAAATASRTEFDSAPHVCRVRRGDRALRHLRVKARELSVGPRQDVRTIVVIQDVTELVAAQHEFSALQDRLSHVARLVAIGEIASGIAHEINQPLAAITSYAGALQRTIDANRDAVQQAQEIADAIAAQALRAGEVVRRVRMLVKHANFEFRSTCINDTVRDVMILAEPLAKAHQVAVTLELADSLPRLRADAIQLQLLLLNLVRNSIEAIDANGSTDRRITIRSTWRPAQGVDVSVEDTGGGISPKALENLFRPFNTTKPQGVGLGLLSCQRIAEAHGGTLNVESLAGTGARFSLILPQLADAATERVS